MAISPVGGYLNQGASYSANNASHTSLPNSNSFDSYSSGDSTVSWDMVATPSPSRSEFFGHFDRDGFSASPTPMFASTSGHHFIAGPQNGYCLGDPSLMYSEPFHRNAAGQDHMTYGLQ